MINHAALLQRYSQLVNSDLPAAAKASKQYPVWLNHCFGRIILDAVCGQQWREVLVERKPGYRQLSSQQLQKAVIVAETMLVSPCVCHDLNVESLRYRGKLK